MPPLLTVSTCGSVRGQARWCSSCHVHARSSVDQRLGPLPMMLLWTFSWRFLLILARERARRVNWGVAPHPAQVGLSVRKCPQAYLVDNIEPRKPDLQTQQAEVLLSSAENTARFGLTASGWTLHGEVVRPKSRFQFDVTDTFQLAKQKHAKFLKEKRT